MISFLFSKSAVNLVFSVVLIEITAQTINDHSKVESFGYSNNHLEEYSSSKNGTSHPKLYEIDESLKFQKNMNNDKKLSNTLGKLEPNQILAEKSKSIKRSISGKSNSGLSRPGYNKTTPQQNPFAVIVHVIFRISHGPLTLEEPRNIGGALIHKSWVLTSASSLTMPDGKRKQVTVLAGNTRIVFDGEKDVNETGNQTREAESVFIHPEFSRPLKRLDVEYDFALIKLKEGFNMTATVGVVNMSPRGWTYKGYHGCEVTAFGNVFEESGTTDDYARKTHKLSVARFNNTTCQHWENPLLFTEPKEGYGLCRGDYGAALVCDKEITGVFSNVYSKGQMESCFNGAVNSTTYECGSSKTYTMFQDTCACIRFVNEKVKLFPEEDIEDCRREKSCGDLIKSSQLILLIISVLVLDKFL